MRKVTELIGLGESYFGSGGYTTPQFNDFFNLFKKSFHKEVKKLGATEYICSRGHFYLSGFFKVNENWYYYSISDVRHFPDKKMLVRTAKHEKDYTGGSNNYVKIDTNIAKSIARTFNLNIIDTNTIKKDRWSIVDKKVDDILKAKETQSKFKFKVSSMSIANSIAWKLIDKLGLENQSITVWKRGKSIVKAECSNTMFDYYYNADHKQVSIIFN